LEQQQQLRLFSGLRVRMGVASGVVRRGEQVKQSQVYRMAQGEARLDRAETTVQHVVLAERSSSSSRQFVT
jgi:hypothetical protein